MPNNFCIHLWTDIHYLLMLLIFFFFIFVVAISYDNHNYNNDNGSGHGDDVNGMVNVVVIGFAVDCLQLLFNWIKPLIKIVFNIKF